MNAKEWHETLFEIYKQFRDLPHWADVYDLHDEEDKNYFDMLDKEVLNEKHLVGRSKEVKEHHVSAMAG